jgi:ribosomal-protein-alanine N-acetyltransferase
MKTPPEVIDGARVRLLRAVPEDAKRLFTAAADPDVMRYMEWAAQTSDSETRMHLEQVARRWQEETEFQWIVEERATGNLAGTVSCRPRGHSADFGYFLARSQWGKGFALEASALVVDWLRAQPEIFRIWATADAENIRSHRVLERLGLQREGVLRMASYRPNIGGHPRDTAMYAWCKRSV